MKKQETPEERKRELEAISPWLAARGKRNPFNVPEQYFENLPQQLEATKQQLNSTSAAWLKPLHTAFSTIAQTRVAIPIAAVVLMAIAVKHILFQPVKLPHVSVTTIITREQAHEFVMNNIDEFSDYELMHQLPNPQLQHFEWQQNFNREIEQFLLEDFDERMLDHMDFPTL
jgi:hypothetical protein